MLISAQVSSSYICQASTHSAKRAPHGRSHHGVRDGRTGSRSCDRKERHSLDTIVIELLLEVEERPPHERYKYGQKYTFSPNSCNAHSPKPLSQCKCGTNSPLPNSTKSHDLSPTSVAEITTPWHHCLGHYHTSKSPRLLLAAHRGGKMK